MSFTKNDRNLQPRSGKSFPIGDRQVGPSFIQAITSALRTEFGGGPSGLKTVARFTGANERAVRNWFEGKNGPSGENLIILIQHSDTVLKTVLSLADRRGLAVAASLAGLRRQLVGAVAGIDDLQQSDT
jgi:hypothetical protein